MALIGVALAMGATAASAQTRSSVTGKIKRYTPSCSSAPDALITGRFAGLIGFGTPGTVSIEACFYSVPACEAWLRRASGEIGGRIFLAVCERRR
ncbi:hypothetical protein [Acuticoccus sediminis]|uniref:hypothetical protein n=1 Tax=Acuticoccus sediminis TaxID=2184697 RepID=UPI0011B934DF|nr:hypothetical protein [Acuticoccus sediminis]